MNVISARSLHIMMMWSTCVILNGCQNPQSDGGPASTHVAPASLNIKSFARCNLRDEGCDPATNPRNPPNPPADPRNPAPNPNPSPGDSHNQLHFDNFSTGSSFQKSGEFFTSGTDNFLNGDKGTNFSVSLSTLGLPKNTIFNKFEIEFDLYISEWSTIYAGGFYNVFALLRNGGGEGNIFIDSDIRGPHDNRGPVGIVDASSDPRLPKRTANGQYKKSYNFEPGQTYHFRSDYDKAARQIMVFVYKGNTLVTQYGGAVKRPTTPLMTDGTANNDLELSFGFALNPKGQPYDGAYMPAPGWTYSNLAITFGL